MSSLNIHHSEVHLLKPNDIPLARLRVERQVGVLNLTKLESTRLGLTAADRALQVVVAGHDGEVGQGDIPRVAGCDRRRAFILMLANCQPGASIFDLGNIPKNCADAFLGVTVSWK